MKSGPDRVFAAGLQAPLDDSGLPCPIAWGNALPVTFCSDWRGENSDPQRETEARLLWSRECLFIRFRCRYREIYAYEPIYGRRDRLWLRDVAEVFTRPGRDDSRHYKEFEISPNGDWLDLDISAGQKRLLMCDIKSRVVTNPEERIWIAELALPMNSLVAEFDPSLTWRINLFRIEGREPNRFYSAWRPTYTPQPNFHVPELFGELRFS